MSVEEIDSKRTLLQNKKMWPMLHDFSRQVPHRHTRGGKWVTDLMPPQSWKAVLTAAFERETEMAEGIEGGMVMVGASTSNYGKRQMADFIECMYAIGSAKGVRWSEKSRELIAAALDSQARKAA